MKIFNVDDEGSEGMGVEICCDRAGEELCEEDYIGIELFSDIGSGTCYFKRQNIDKLISIFESIKKELRPQ